MSPRSPRDQIQKCPLRFPGTGGGCSAQPEEAPGPGPLMGYLCHFHQGAHLGLGKWHGSPSPCGPGLNPPCTHLGDTNSRRFLPTQLGTPHSKGSVKEEGEKIRPRCPQGAEIWAPRTPLWVPREGRPKAKERGSFTLPQGTSFRGTVEKEGLHLAEEPHRSFPGFGLCLEPELRTRKLEASTGNRRTIPPSSSHFWYTQRGTQLRSC